MLACVCANVNVLCVSRVLLEAEERSLVENSRDDSPPRLHRESEQAARSKQSRAAGGSSSIKQLYREALAAGLWVERRGD